MVFQVSRTFKSPGTSQAGFPAPGSGAQTTGKPRRQPGSTPWFTRRPTKGTRSFQSPVNGENAQRGYPAPQGLLQKRPPGFKNPPIFGGVFYRWTPYYDRGAAAYVPNFGKVLYNPIGAGVAVNHRPQASYGVSGQYIQGSIYWTSQVIPTSVNLQGLTSPQVLAAILSQEQIYGVVKVSQGN